jgi:nucleoid-associated protein YgaU
MIYDDGYIIEFPDTSLALSSSFNPYNIGSVVSETSYLVKEDDSLFSISAQFYNNTRNWYIIAEWNNITDILDLTLGLEIKIPNFG